MITLKDWITSSDKYPEREKHLELTPLIRANANSLLIAVNLLLSDLGALNPQVSSGFRPSDVNSKIQNAAKKSLHMTGLAIDLEDDAHQSLAKLILTRPELLKKYGLWLEDTNSTKGKNSNWVHLDLKPRSPRKVQVFRP